MHDLDQIHRLNQDAVDRHLEKLRTAANAAENRIAVVRYTGLNVFDAVAATDRDDADAKRDDWVKQCPGNSAQLRPVF